MNCFYVKGEIILKDIYLPNLLRIENYKDMNTSIDATIPYFMDFNLDDNNEFRALITYQLSNILEKIVLFDRIYLDLIELPIFIKELALLDLSATKYILDKGLLSYIDIKDIRISTMSKRRNNDNNYTTNQDRYTLVAYGRLNATPLILSEFESYINSFITDKNIYEELKPFLKKIFDSRKKINSKIDEEKMVNELHKTLKLGTFSKIGIGQNNYYFITDKNKNIYNLICRFFRDNYITKKFGIYTYYFDDTIEALSILINNKKFIYDEEFFSISDINKLPDLRLMILSGDLDIKDIVKIIKSKHISNFRKWFFNLVDNGEEIEKEFVALLKKENPIPVKLIRFIIPNIAGFIPAYGSIAGIALDTLDTFLAEKLLQNSTCKFIDNYANIITKKEYNNKTQLKKIYIPVKNKIEIDNSLEGIDQDINIIATILTMMEKNIDYRNDLAILNIYLDATNISGKLWKYNIVMERYLHLCLCLTKYVSKYSFVILKTMEELYSVVDIIDSFIFAREYYFESYYNLVNDLKLKGLHISNNPFKIENDLSVKEKYIDFVHHNIE